MKIYQNHQGTVYRLTKQEAKNHGNLFYQWGLWNDGKYLARKLSQFQWGLYLIGYNLNWKWLTILAFKI